MRTVWKFPLKIQDYQEIEMPVDSKILAVQTQYGHPYIWAIVHDDRPASDEDINIRIVGTGHEFNEEYKQYIGTFQLSYLVFHVFEI